MHKTKTQQKTQQPAGNPLSPPGHNANPSPTSTPANLVPEVRGCHRIPSTHCRDTFCPNPLETSVQGNLAPSQVPVNK